MVSDADVVRSATTQTMLVWMAYPDDAFVVVLIS
jgi:hypothetical protein